MALRTPKAAGKTSKTSGGKAASGSKTPPRK